ncbi:MAG: 30S ribosomal protein S3 [Patescibacteria group bacterium]|jgi:small subunit ribosomal protein S3
MGQKVDPRSFRLNGTTTWKSKWFSQNNFGELLEMDQKIRTYLSKKLREAGLARVEIERSSNALTIHLHTSRPGVVIGRGGAGVEDLKKIIRQKFLKTNQSLNVNIHEVAQPFLSAELVVQSMIDQIEKRMPFRRVLKTTIQQVERAGAQGIKVMVAGRLNGAEIARTEKLTSGKIPLHTIRADIDYAQGTARTTYGAIGIKAWVYRGDVFQKETQKPKA